MESVEFDAKERAKKYAGSKFEVGASYLVYNYPVDGYMEDTQALITVLRRTDKSIVARVKTRRPPFEWWTDAPAKTLKISVAGTQERVKIGSYRRRNTIPFYEFNAAIHRIED